MIILSRYIFFKYLFFPIFNHYNIFVYYLNYIYLLSDPSYEQILLILNVLIYAYIRFNEPIKQTYICKKCINANINNVWKCVWQKERLRKKEAGVSSSWKHRDQHLITETRPSVRVWDLQHTGHRPQISSDGVWHHQTPWEPQRNERKAHLTCGARQTFSKERKASLNTLNGWNQRLISSASKHARKTHEGPTSLFILEQKITRFAGFWSPRPCRFTSFLLPNLYLMTCEALLHTMQQYPAFRRVNVRIISMYIWEYDETRIIFPFSECVCIFDDILMCKWANDLL